MPGVCEGAGRGAAGGDAVGVSCATGGAFGDAARACVAQRAGGCSHQRRQWRRFAADAGWRGAADGGGDADMGRREAAELKERKQLEDELTMAKHEAWILTDPSSKKIMIMPSDKSMPMVEAMWHPKMGIYVTAQQMPMPKNNKVLQLWLIPKTPGAKPMPSHVFWPDANGKIGEMVANPPDDMGDTKALAITEEPPGGSPQPTSTPMWVGGVS